jgi:fructuronate reductase
MKLSNNELKNRKQWEEKGYKLPKFDRDAVRERTKKEPVWVHIGAGNIFRAHIAMITQHLLDEGQTDRGIIAAESYDYEIIDKAYTPYDDLSVLVTLKADGSSEKTVVASVAESVKMDTAGLPRLKDIFAAESLQLVSLTITEKGYNLTGTDGLLLPDIEADIKTEPSEAKSSMGKLAFLCRHRYLTGAAPLTLVSMDNCSKNGDRLYEAISYFAVEWVKRGFCEKDFLNYVNDRKKLSFPWTMIDKITPWPNENVAQMLRDTGLEECEGFITAKETYIAPFINAEETEYLVIEDAFPNGRPPLEKAGVFLTNRETVEKTEKMKVCTCLNPLHTALAIFGCLLSYTYISEAMKDPLLLKLVRKVADEGLPVVVDPKIISPSEFINTVINVRLPNPSIPDTLLRITVDTSAKVSVRFGETIKAYMNSKTLNSDNLTAIPLVLAGWCRYLLGTDDNGKTFELSFDPILPIREPLQLLSNNAIFGVNLYEAGLAGRVEEYFKMMQKEPGAIRRTLEAVLEHKN